MLFCYKPPLRLLNRTAPMLIALQKAFEDAAKDSTIDVMILTGAGTYYCAGVNLSGVLKPMHPQSLHDYIEVNKSFLVSDFKRSYFIYAPIVQKHNRSVFDTFLDFPKPIIAALNGPAIGASCTTVSLRTLNDPKNLPNPTELARTRTRRLCATAF